MYNIFEKNFNIIRVNNIEFIDDYMWNNYKQAHKIDKIDDLQDLYYAYDVYFYIAKRMTNRDYDKLLKITEDIRKTTHLVLFTQTTDIPHTLISRADNYYFDNNIVPVITMFKLTDKDKETIDKSYYAKVEKLLQVIDEIPFANVIKLAKTVRATPFLKIIGQTLENINFYNDPMLLVELRKSIEDIEYYNLNETLVLVHFLSKLKNNVENFKKPLTS